MQFSLPQLLALTITASQVSAKTITVEVGQDGLSFSPDNIKAAEGDIVDFHFDSSHSVNSGPFAKPCSPSTEGGFGSGPLPNGDNVRTSLSLTPTLSRLLIALSPGSRSL
jgi:plastocyanin